MWRNCVDRDQRVTATLATNAISYASNRTSADYTRYAWVHKHQRTCVATYWWSECETLANDIKLARRQQRRHIPLINRAQSTVKHTLHWELTMTALYDFTFPLQKYAATTGRWNNSHVTQCTWGLFEVCVNVQQLKASTTQKKDFNNTNMATTWCWW